MERFNGLPAHPLFVHAPVVLVPLAVLATLALVARPGWRQRFGPVLAGLAVVATIATFLAIRSGDALATALGQDIDPSKHKNLALTTRWLVLGFTLGTLVYVALDRLRRPADASPDQPGSGSVAAWAVAGLTAVVGLAAAWWMYRTGEAGASLVWNGVLPRE